MCENGGEARHVHYIISRSACLPRVLFGPSYFPLAGGNFSLSLLMDRLRNVGCFCWVSSTFHTHDFPFVFMSLLEPLPFLGMSSWSRGTSLSLL